MQHATRSKARIAEVGVSSTVEVQKAGDVKNEQSEYGSTRADEFLASEAEEGLKERPKKRRAIDKTKNPRADIKDDAGNETTRKRIAGCLSVLLSMPMDILFEIFSHLSPEDLVRLSRASKVFRQVLLSKQSAFLWNDAFEKSESGTPPCPEDVTVLAWANLLFGGSYCQHCGTKGVRKILFGLRMRLCQKCVSSTLVPYMKAAPRFETKHFRPLSYQLDRLLPAAPDRHGYMHFLERDISALLTDLGTLCNGLSDRDACTAVEKFCQERKAAFNPRRLHAESCLEWERRRQSARGTELYEIRSVRREEIVKRIKALGYEKDDACHIWRLKGINISQPLTNRAWDKLFPTIKASLDRMKSGRMNYLRGQRQEERFKKINTIYLNYLKILPPMDVPTLPSPYQCTQFEPFKTFADTDVEELTAEWHEEVQKSLPQTFRAIFQKRLEIKSILVSRLPHEEFTPREGDVSEAELDRRLALATSVYQTVRHGLVPRFGFEPLMYDGHTSVQCWNSSAPPYEWRHDPKFWHFGREVVEHILLCLGKSKNTTAVELDITDERLIVHAARKHRAGDKLLHDFNMRMLTPQEYSTVLVLEKGPSFLVSRRWGCCHCNIQLEPSGYDPRGGSWRTLDFIKEHLKDKHNIEEPHDGVDFFWNRGIPRSHDPGLSLPEPQATLPLQQADTALGQSAHIDDGDERMAIVLEGQDGDDCEQDVCKYILEKGGSLSP
ncbi:hypothetical protein K488DRAFT_84870 [Vararia minispora EC-137]|uniref:Uncharacterized protein n=1 Tax=Vararia minispora EC-137 TaxID=1314806 RepID=A0ACB8QQ27_9AGAM|nr:hypothetical protein K488DRAFT_84870 [Vararia minispora EC-137]